MSTPIMDPHSFQELLDRATETAPPPPIDADSITPGRQRLRRHRLLTGSLALAGVVVLGGAAAGLAGSHASNQPTIASDPPSTDAQLLDACRHGNQGDRATQAIFGSGTPTVEASVKTDYQWQLAIQSADGRYWAECFVHLQSAEFASGMTVYDGTQSGGGLTYAGGPGCGLVDGEVDRTCPTYAVWTVDRLPEAVVAVRYGFGDGTSQTVSSVNGYVVLNHLGQVSAGIKPSLQSMGITRITYLDASGAAIAAEALDGSGTGPDRDRVDGLPALSAYPSLRGEIEVS